MTASIDDFKRTHNVIEKWWTKYQPLLLSRGYQLRPRYRPGWVPSWTVPGSNFDPVEENYSEFEDSISEHRLSVLDGIRVSDNQKVVFRRIITPSPELSITRFLNHFERRQNPHNRTVQLLDIIPLPDDDSLAIIVIPFLRAFDKPVFRHLREVVEAMRQYFQGLHFMHSCGVAHRDACTGNMLMDATKVIPGGFHFRATYTENGDISYPPRWRDRCLVAPVEYYFIDFGLSSFFPEGEDNARDIGVLGQDKTVPELSETVPYNPFKVDIYQLGNVWVELSKFHPAIEQHFGPLLASMTRVKPEERPTAAQAVAMLEAACSRIPPDNMVERLGLICESPRYYGEMDSENELLSDWELEQSDPESESDLSPEIVPPEGQLDSNIRTEKAGRAKS